MRTQVRPEAVPEADRIPDPRPRATPLWALLSRWLLALEAWLRSHGGKRLRGGIRAFWALVAAAGAFLLFGPVINPPLSLDDITSSASTATDRWIARHLTADYALDRDEDGALRVRVEERIDAFFPDDVDESGIERVLAVEYQGHALDPADIAATLDGEPLEIRRTATPERLTLILDAGERLDGDHEFVLTYTLHDLAYRADDEATGAPVDLLAWDVFGPSWPQGVAGLDVTITVPEELDAELLRPPRGFVGWTLVGAGDWLEPEPGGPTGTVGYGFSNDQNLPPHAQASFTLVFPAGTFTPPAPTPLFLLQTFGPLLPLAVLLVTLLFALAARAVAWSDERGEPWFVAQYAPPADVSPALAAQILRTPRPRALAVALGRLQPDARTAPLPEHKAAAARVANRTGRLGDILPAWARAGLAPEHAEQYERGLRRVPRGFVRDYFTAAPLALTVLQWGLVRQLSHQAPLAVVWWPAAFVAASTVLAVVVLAIARGARPLTREGALVTQHLRGIHVYAERTSLLERAVSDDPLLPYAVLTVPPRTAGRRVRDLLAHELGDPRAGRRGWRTQGFLTWPSMLAAAWAALTVLAAVAIVAFVPNPYDRDRDLATYTGVPGTLYTTVSAADLSAELRRTADGHAELAVTERLDVAFDDSSWRVPQLAAQWPDSILGQDLGLRVDHVRVDGAGVPYTVEREGDTTLLVTAMNDVLTGDHDVEIGYTLDTAAFAAEDADGAVVDRVRWSALWDGWEYFSQWADDPHDPQRIEFRLSEELAALAVDAGWISRDTAPEEPRDWPETVVPFGTVGSVLDDVNETDETVEETPGHDVHVLELRRDPDDGGYPFALTVDDVGVRLDFPAGTFAEPDADALRLAGALKTLPIAATLAWGAVATVLGLLALLLRAGGATSPVRRGGVRTLLRWVTAASALAALIVLFGVAMFMDGDDPTFFWFLGAAGAGTAAAVCGWLTTRRRAPAS